MKDGFSKALRNKDLLAALLLVLLPILFLWRVTLGDRVLLPSDNLFLADPWKAYAASFGATVPHNPLISDMVLQNFEWRRFFVEALRGGYLPLWNPYIFSGTPFLAAGQQGILYPGGMLFYLMPVAKAYGWFTALHLALGSLFFYLYMRVIGARRAGAIIAAVTFAFSSVLVVSFLWPMVISTAVWLPLLLVIIEVMVRDWERGHGLRRSLPWLAVGALAVGLQFLAGHMEYSFYVLFSAGFYALARLIVFAWQVRAWRRPVVAGASLLVMVAFGTGLGSVQILPFSEVGQRNFRAGTSVSKEASGFAVPYREVVRFALPTRHIAAFVIPDFFGNPTSNSYRDVFNGERVAVTNAADSAGAPRSYPFWGIKNYVEGAAYLGILPLVLALVALIWRRNRYTWIFALYALFSLLLAFGTPLYAIFFFGVPGFNQLHTPFRWLFPYTVSVAVLAGTGASVLLGAAGKARESASNRGLARLGAAAAFGGGGLLLLLLLSRVLSGPTLRLADKLRDRSHDLSAAFQSGRMLYSYELRNFLIFAALFLCSGILVWLAGRGLRPSRARAFQAVMVGLVVADLFVLGMGFNSATKPELIEFTPPSLQFLQRDGSLYRVASFGYEDILSPDTSMLAGLQDIRGYDSIILRQYVEFWSALEEPHGLLYSKIHKIVQETSLGSPLLNLLNVKYILSAQRLERPNLEEVYRGDDLYIYRNRDTLPRAFAVFSEARPANDAEALAMLRDPAFDPARRVVIQGTAEATPLPEGAPAQTAQVEVESYKPNQVSVRASMPAEGYLLLADTYYPGWRAEVDGKEASVLRADYNFRAVRLPAGEHAVTFRFSPDSLKLGLYMSLLSLVLVLLMLGYGLWNRLWRENMEASAVRRIAKNSVTPMAAQIAGRVLDFGFAIFMLRLLGPTNAGRYAFAVFLIGYFLILTDFGLGTLLTREVARDRSQANRYLGNTIVMRLWLCLASMPIILAVVGLYYWRFDLTSSTAFAILLFTLSLVPSAIASAISAVFNAYEKMEFPAAVAIVTTALRVSLGVAALLLGWGIVGLAGVSVVASTVTAVIFLVLLRKSFFRPTFEIDGSFQREMAKVAAPLMLNNFLSTIFFRIDVMLLKPMRGDAATGYYTTAYKFIDGLNIIPAFFTMAIFPIMSRHAEASRESLLYTFERSLKVMLIVALPITVITTIIAGQIIPLFFGQDYAPSTRALQILIWFLPFSYVNSVTQYALIAVNQQRFLTVAFLIGVGFNIVANLVAIPLWGFTGAAGVTIASEVVLMVPFFYSVRRHLGSLPLLSIVQRPAIAALTMGVVLLPLREVNWVLISLLGFAVYGGALFLLGTFDEADRRLLRALRARQ